MDDGERLSAQGPWLHWLLVHLAGRSIRARVDIEDLVQEVFLRALGHKDGLPPHEEGEGPLRRVLATIARHAVLDVARSLRTLKRSGKEIRLSRSDWSRTGMGESQIPLKGPSPSTVVSEKEELARHLAAFDTLTAEHRRVLGLRQFEGLSAAETGRRMGRSETAIHSLFRRALQAWSDALS